MSYGLSRLNPEIEAEMRAVIALAWQVEVEQDQVANESARIWADAYEQGGAEAAKEALRKRLIELQGRRSPAKEALREHLVEMERRSRTKQPNRRKKQAETNEDSE